MPTQRPSKRRRTIMAEQSTSSKECTDNADFDPKAVPGFPETTLPATPKFKDLLRFQRNSSRRLWPCHQFRSLRHSIRWIYSSGRVPTTLAAKNEAPKSKITSLTESWGSRKPIGSFGVAARATVPVLVTSSPDKWQMNQFSLTPQSFIHFGVIFINL